MELNNADNRAVASIPAALGLDEVKYDLEYVKRCMVRLRQSMPTKVLTLRSLRLDRACMEHMADHFEKRALASSQQHQQPSEICLYQSFFAPQDGCLGEGGLGRLVKAMEDQLKSFRFVDRKSLVIHPNQIGDLFSSLQYAKNCEVLQLRNLHLVEGGEENFVGSKMRNMLLKQASLTSLTIGRCDIDPTIMKFLAAALPHMPSLRIFSMKNCVVTGNQDTSRAKLFESLISSSAQHLELRRMLGTSASSLLVSRLLREKQNLVVLDLSFTPGIFQNLAEGETSSIASSLVAAPRLKHLWLNYCPSVGSAFASAIFRALEHREAQPLEELGLLGCRSFGSTDWITTSLPHIHGLRVLFVPHNLRSPPVAAALLRALETNTSLWHVSGEGRWRQPGPQVQRMLTRNKRLHEATCAVQSATPESLWPLALNRLASNPATTLSASSICTTVEMSPVFVFLRAFYPTYAAETAAFG